MAHYTVTYACGHSMDKQLFGKMDDRRAHIEWAVKHGTCTDCAKADKLAAAAGVEAEHNLTALTGSEKQIAWARSIRAEKVNAIATWFASGRARAEAANEAESYDEQVAALIAKLGAQASASWWIDRRMTDTQSLVQQVLRGA